MKNETLLELIWKFNKDSITSFFFFSDVNMNFGLVNNDDIIVQTSSAFICQTING